MEAIPYSYLIALGILLIGVEALTFSFVLMFMGLGFFLVGVLSSFIHFESAIVQIALSLSLALLLAYFLRNTLIKKISKPQTQQEDKVHKSGLGVFEDGMVRFEGTFWDTDENTSFLKDGDQVEVVDIVNNKVVLKH
jgi:membrane protein implicated in regulation of membrane protease activity